MGRFLRPLTYGHYPREMLEELTIRMPEFTKEESEKLKTSLDFVGLNYYGAFFSTPLASVNSSQLNYHSDLRVNWTGIIINFDRFQLYEMISSPFNINFI